MASGHRSPMPKPFGPFGAGPPYTRPAPPTRAFYAPCLPSKRALLLQLTADRNLPHPQSSTPQMSPLPTHHPTTLSFPFTQLTYWHRNFSWLPLSPATPSPWRPLPPSFPTCHRVMYPAHVSPERGDRTRGPHPSPCTIFIVRYEPDRRKVRIIFWKSYQIQERIPETLPGL